MHVVIAVSTAALAVPVLGQQQSHLPAAPGYALETARKPAPADATIKELPLEVDMELAKKFVVIGFGSRMPGKPGFQSTQFLTPRLGTRQAAELIRLVPEYGNFRSAPVADAILKFSRRVSAIQFGREGSPVLYVNLPYWTHQQEGPITKGLGARIAEIDHQKLVQELRKVFVDQLHADEFDADPVNGRTIRIWWQN